MNIVELGGFELALGAGLLLLLAALLARLRFGLSRRILIAGLRTTTQLLGIGVILTWLFARRSPAILGLLALAMLLVAGREVMQRQHYRLAGWWGYAVGTLSMFISSFSLALVTLTVIIDIEPWYHPQYAIPLLGMLLGNTMNGISLGVDRLTAAVWQHRQTIEARLALGEPWREAVRDFQRDGVRAGLTPTLNAMAAAGIVSLPGMMTGQILAGSPPLTAVAYQILIMFLIGAGSGFGTLAAVLLAARRLFDERHRLRLDRLREERP